MDVLNRKTLTVFNQLALDGIINGCASVKWPYVTAVEPLYSSCPQFSNSLVYDLQGRLLNNIPDKGIYIVNGRKIKK